MQKQLIPVLDSIFSELIKSDFNLGIFINNFEQKVFQDFNFSRNFNNDPQNILIVRTDGIGDYVLTTPFIRGIRENYPYANIILVVSPLVYNLAKTNQYVDEVYIFEGSMNYRIIEFAILELIQCCYKYIWFKNNKFRQIDIAFSPQCGTDNQLPMLLSYFSGATKRIGYGINPFAVSDIEDLTIEKVNEAIPNNFMDFFVITDLILLTNNEVHEVEKNIYILKVLHLNYSSDELELTLENGVIDKVKQYINKNKKNIIVNIGGSQLQAIYDINKLNQALELINEDNNYIFVGGINDLERMQYITVPHINIVGKISLQEMAALMSLSDLYIGNDTGAMHIAAVYKIPIIEISREAKNKIIPKQFSSIQRFHPWHTKYIIVQPEDALDKCKEAKTYGGCCYEVAHCINAIEPYEIAKAYKKILK